MKPAASPVLRATRLLNQIRELICNEHYILRTEHAYVQLPGLWPWMAWGCRKARFFKPCCDGFRAASWMAAQGRLLVFAVPHVSHRRSLFDQAANASGPDCAD